jgi:putative flippase GtrA
MLLVDRIGVLAARLARVMVLRYVAVAAVGAAVDLALFAILVFVAEVHYLWAGVAGFLVATGVNYVLSIRFVFRRGARFNRLHEIGIIYAVSATGLLWHQLILWYSVEFAGLHVMVSKCLALGVVFGWNYLMRKHFIFARVR